MSHALLTETSTLANQAELDEVYNLAFEMGKTGTPKPRALNLNYDDYPEGGTASHRTHRIPLDRNSHYAQVFHAAYKAGQLAAVTTADDAQAEVEEFLTLQADEVAPELLPCVCLSEPLTGQGVVGANYLVSIGKVAIGWVKGQDTQWRAVPNGGMCGYLDSFSAYPKAMPQVFTSVNQAANSLAEMVSRFQLGLAA